MSKVKAAVVPEETTTTLKDQIEQRLHTALAEWKTDLGEKKFAKRIRKAVEIFGKDLKSPPVAKTTRVKKIAAAKVPKAPSKK